MDLPRNRLKAALQQGRQQFGVWNAMDGRVAPEIVAGAGFDWVVVDTEHAPLGVTDALPALQAIGQYPDVSAVVRVAANDTVLIKRVLDLGALSIMVPYVETAEEARAAVAAMRYGPRGIRGLAGTTRATRYGRVAEYATRAEEELCLIVQIETAQGVENADDIAAVDGVDAIFIGPADLSASMGMPGQLAHEGVVAAIHGLLRRMRDSHKPAGILCLDEASARAAMDHGSTLTAVGIDSGLLVNALSDLRKRFD